MELYWYRWRLVCDVEQKYFDIFKNRNIHNVSFCTEDIETLTDCPPYSFATQSRLLTPMEKKAFENIMGKGENAGNQHFLLFPQCFQSYQRQ